MLDFNYKRMSIYHYQYIELGYIMFLSETCISRKGYLQQFNLIT